MGGDRERPTGAQEIAQEVLGHIAREQLQPGDRLPSERNLAEQMGVSRCSLREALRLLEAQGRVQVETGRGCYVSAAPAEPGALSARRADTSELIEAQAALLPRAASLAAQRRSDQQLQALAEGWRQVEAARQAGDHAAMAELAAQLYRQMARAAGNQLLAEMVDCCLELTRFVGESVVRSPLTRPGFCRRLGQVVEAIGAHDWPAAQGAMRLHVLEGALRLGLLTQGRVDEEARTWLDQGRGADID